MFDSDKPSFREPGESALGKLFRTRFPFILCTLRQVPAPFVLCAAQENAEKRKKKKS